MMNRMRRWGAWVATVCAAVFVTIAGMADAAAQARITTKKFRLADFTDRVTKVVLSGNGIMDTALKQEVADRWTVSPFEFCTSEEFASLKQSDRYYFLLFTTRDEAAGTGRAGEKTDEAGSSGMQPGSTALRCLTLIKGGTAANDGLKVKGGATGSGNGKATAGATGNNSNKAAARTTGNGNGDAAGGIEGMMEVISVPIGSDAGFGRELVFLPAMLDIVQDFAVRAMEDEVSGYSGLSIYNANYRKDGRIKRICLSLGDIAPQVDAVQMGRLDEDILLVGEEEADEAFQKGTFNTLVSFVVAPEDPAPGTYCYKMLIDAETHSLYYFKRHKITAKNGVGFLPSDLRTLSKGR